MKRLILGLALGVVPAFGGGVSVKSAPISLFTEFQQAPPAAVIYAIQEELGAIMEPAGLHFDWYPLQEASHRVSVQLAVVHFKGACDAEDLRPQWAFPGPLGWTHVSDGEILPFIDINCEGVRLFVQRQLIEFPVSDREMAFGRAVGRVLAHELYHFLVNTKTHPGGGVAKAAYSVGELLSDSLHFGKKEREALRARAKPGHAVVTADGE